MSGRPPPAPRRPARRPRPGASAPGRRFPACGRGVSGGRDAAGVAAPALLAVLASVALAAAATLSWAAIPPRVLGAIEEVVLVPPGLRLRARVDTGATLSSVDAHAISVLGQGLERRVRFELAGEDGRRIAVERPLVAVAEVVNADGQAERRPIVRLDICVAGARIPTEVTLNDRTGLEHRVLLGRKLLAGRFVVDVAQRFTAPASCSARR